MIKDFTAKKKLLIIGIIALILIIGILLWLFILKGNQRDFTGTWILTEIRYVSEGKNEKTDIDKKIVMTDSKNGTLYTNEIKECEVTINKNKLTCSDNNITKKVFKIVDSPTGLYLHDESSNLIYLFKDGIAKNGFHVSIENWEIDEKQSNLSNSEMEYPSVDELKTLSNSFIEKTDTGIEIKIPLNFKFSKSTDELTYRYNIVNDGTENINIRHGYTQVSSSHSTNTTPVVGFGECYLSPTHDEYITSEPRIILPGEKLYCTLNFYNETSGELFNASTETIWHITKSN